MVLLLSAVCFAAVSVCRPEMGSTANLQNMFLSALPLALLSIGQTFVVITGGIDLSLAGVVSLASVLGASVMTAGSAESTSATLAGTAIVLATGLTVGLAHGVSVAVAGMPPFLVTLTSLMFCGGCAAWYTKSEPISGLPDSLLKLDYGATLGLPNGLWLVGGLALAAHVLLAHTIFGRQVYAIGQNPRTARVSGLPTTQTTIAVYMFCGLAAGVAALLYMARLETAKPQLVKDDVLLDCLGAVVIGGVSLVGGRGTVFGALLGTLFIVQIGNSLNLFGSLQIWHVLMIKGGVVLVAAWLDAVRRRWEVLET